MSKRIQILRATFIVVCMMGSALFGAAGVQREYRYITPEEIEAFIHMPEDNTIMQLFKSGTFGIEESEVLLRATKAKNLPLVEFLIASGANVNKRDYSGSTVLINALKPSEREGVDTVHEYMRDEINKRVMEHTRLPEDMTKLVTDTLYGDVTRSIVKKLLEAGADPNATYNVSASLRTPANDEWIQSVDGTTPLMYAVQSDDSELVDMLLAQKVDVNAKSASGETILDYFNCDGGNSKILWSLIDAGLDINVESHRDGETLLMCAVSVNDVALVEMLLEEKTDIDAVDNSGKSILHYWQSDNLEILKALVKAGFDIHKADDAGETILFTLYHPKPEVWEYLVKAGLNINAQNNNGVSVLMATAGCDCEKGVADIKWLMEHGADVTLENVDGDTIFDVVQDYPKILKALLQYPRAQKAYDAWREKRKEKKNREKEDKQERADFTKSQLDLGTSVEEGNF